MCDADRMTDHAEPGRLELQSGLCLRFLICAMGTCSPVTSGCCAHHPTQRTVKLLGPRPAHCEPQIQAITAVQTTEKQKRFRLASSGFQADGFLSSPLSCAAPSLFSGSQARLKVGQLSAGL